MIEEAFEPHLNRRDPARQLVIEEAFEPHLNQRDPARQEQINHRRRAEHGKELEVLPDDLLRAKRQLVDEDHRRDRRQLQHADGVVGETRDHRAHRLRQDDAAQRQQRSHAERGGRGGLRTVHRQDPGTKQFSAERRFVQCKADNRGRDFIETQTDQRQRVEDEHELQQLRRAAHEPDITPRR